MSATISSGTRSVSSPVFFSAHFPALLLRSAVFFWVSAFFFRAAAFCSFSRSRSTSI